MNRPERLRHQPKNGTNPDLFSSQHSGREEPSSARREYLPSPREELVLWWKNAPEQIISYERGTVTDPTGNIIYEFPEGSTLLIGDNAKGKAKQVMDTCETPWAFAAVDKAFVELAQKSGPLNVLERGFGMGLTARRVIQNLITRGGEYTIIELNKENANYAKEWIRKQKSALSSMASGLPDTKPDINISIMEGEAYEETARLAEKGRKFDIIISDTFPLNEDEHGVNDLQDLATLKDCLEPGGVFTFFAYFPGSTGGVMKNQKDMINEHFASYTVTEITVNPPPDYKYLQTETGPVRILPIVICKIPKI